MFLLLPSMPSLKFFPEARKAFTLIEMLPLIAIAPFMMVVVSGIYATIIRDIPRETKVVQQNTTMLDMLRQVRQDVDGAVGLPTQFQDLSADERTLLIQQPEAVVCYQFQDGRVARTRFVVTPSGVFSDTETAGLKPAPTDVGTSQAESPPDERVWRMPDAVITWRLWVRDDAAYAVEVHSHVEQWVIDMRRTQLANSHVFFIHGLGKGRQVQ